MGAGVYGSPVSNFVCLWSAHDTSAIPDAAEASSGWGLPALEMAWRLETDTIRRFARRKTRGTQSSTLSSRLEPGGVALHQADTVPRRQVYPEQACCIPFASITRSPLRESDVRKFVVRWVRASSRILASPSSSTESPLRTGCMRKQRPPSIVSVSAGKGWNDAERHGNARTPGGRGMPDWDVMRCNALVRRVMPRQDEAIKAGRREKQPACESQV